MCVRIVGIIPDNILGLGHLAAHSIIDYLFIIIQRHNESVLAFPTIRRVQRCHGYTHGHLVFLFLIQQEILHLTGPANRIVCGFSILAAGIGGVQTPERKAIFIPFHPESGIVDLAVCVEIVTRHRNGLLESGHSRLIQASDIQPNTVFRQRERIGFFRSIDLRILRKVQGHRREIFRQRHILRSSGSFVSGQRVRFPYQAQCGSLRKSYRNPVNGIGDLFKPGKFRSFPSLGSNAQTRKAVSAYCALLHRIHLKHIRHLLPGPPSAVVSIVIPINSKRSRRLEIPVFYRNKPCVRIHGHRICPRQCQPLHTGQTKGIVSINRIQAGEYVHTRFRLHRFQGQLHTV